MIFSLNFHFCDQFSHTYIKFSISTILIIFNFSSVSVIKKIILSFLLKTCVGHFECLSIKIPSLFKMILKSVVCIWNTSNYYKYIQLFIFSEKLGINRGGGGGNGFPVAGQGLYTINFQMMLRTFINVILMRLIQIKYIFTKEF